MANNRRRVQKPSMSSKLTGLINFGSVTLILGVAGLIFSYLMITGRI